MALNHNQYAVVAIAATLCLAGFYTIIDAGLSTTESGGFSSAGDDVISSGPEDQQAGQDFDGDGIPDRMEQTLYGTDWRSSDTDGDGLEDGWEIDNGLDPLDSGTPSDSEIENENPSEQEETGEQNETFPDPDNGPYGDPDRDGLTNEEEESIGTNPTVQDTDGDGLNDRWEAIHDKSIQTAQGMVTLFDPLDPNWGCYLLTPDVEIERKEAIGLSTWEALPHHPNGDRSCDSVLDSDFDTLPNFLEEIYDTNPLERDSDGDLIEDQIEVSRGLISLHKNILDCPDLYNPLGSSVTLMAPFNDFKSDDDDLTWFSQDMDGDGRMNGPGDWDTDGDGMPDGYEYCYSLDHDQERFLNPASGVDAYWDTDDDGMNNLEEYEVAYTWGPTSFTNPLASDSDFDTMPDGWEYHNGVNPRNRANENDDGDFDGYDLDGDGAVRHSEMVGYSSVYSISVEIGSSVSQDSTVMWVQTVQNGEYVNIPLRSPVDGTVYEINVEVGDDINNRLQELIIVVEDSEKFTDLDEYNARDRDGDGIPDGRSTNPLDSDTDDDGLIDGIEVMGWTIRIIDVGVRDVIVRSDPSLYDTDSDGLNDSVEYSITFTNTTDVDTDSDGIEDFTESFDGFTWNGSKYFTNASMFDTDNDGLSDGEEIIDGVDQYITNANDADTDDDGLNDGAEVLHVPRPWQPATNPIDNDTDDDGQPDGWEMQVFSVQENTNSHSLWISTQNWLPYGCEDMQECGLGPGGWVWDSYVTGFRNSGDRNGDGEVDPKYFIYEMNLSGFDIPANGRWALDPSFGSLPDSLFDIDNDTLLNSLEAPDRWDTNPVDLDTDGDNLPDGWEVQGSELAISLGLIDNNTLDALGARGPMDPRMPDSDLDGINDGAEDFDLDGLNQTHLLNRYCPSWQDVQSSECHIDPSVESGAIFYNDLTNYTNYEEFQNGTNPVLDDTDGDGWLDGSEVYHQDHDNDGMWSGWEYYFGLEPYDPADANIDSDGDGYLNKCENEWNTNPKDPTSFPGQGELCTND